jgi:hypothetical protein
MEKLLILQNRGTLHVETITVSTSRWRLVSGGFHIRPGVHVDPLHLRRDSKQPASN